MNERTIGWLSVVGSGANGSMAAIMATESLTLRVAIVAMLAFVGGCAVGARALFTTKPASPPPLPADAIPPEKQKPGVLLLLLLLLPWAAAFVACGHGTPPDPNDPTAPPPSVTLPRDPIAPPFTPFYQTDGGTKS